MKKIIALASFLIFNSIFAQTWTTDEQYIQNFAKYAVEEMEKFKIPASITLAQGLLETGGGQSRLAKEGNNHFGIKCKKGWTGRTMRHTDDAPHECFRVYNNPRESYEDHSKFLAYRPYYKNLFKLDMKDYKAWAHGLKKAGYATNRKYAYILINKIEKYKLYEFDNATSENVEMFIAKLYPTYNEKEVIVEVEVKEEENSPIQEIEQEIEPISLVSTTPASKKLTKAEILRQIKVLKHPNRNVKYFIIPEQITLSDVAKKFGIKEKKLMKYNELKSRILKKNQVVFLEAKNSRGMVKNYKVKKGDTMYMIAQKFAIKLKKLYRRNDMRAGQPLKIGKILKLK